MAAAAELAPASTKSESAPASTTTAMLAPSQDVLAAQLDPALATAPGDDSVTTRLLDRPSLSRQANAPVRAAVLRRTQQTHGNRIAQRAIANAAYASATSSLLVQRACACGGTCDACQQPQHAAPIVPELPDLPDVPVQRETAATGADTVDADSVRPSNGGGTPLDSPTREFMETRFGQDFADVRVHTDAGAAESAHALNANAYTVDRNIVFAAGQYAPETSEGQRLIAHELVHTVQQTGGISRDAGIIPAAPLDFGPAPPDRPLKPHVPDSPRGGAGAAVSIPPSSPGPTCWTGDICARPVPGSATEAIGRATEEEAKKPPNPARPAAVSLRAFAQAQAPGLIPAATRVVVNPNIASIVGAQADTDANTIEVPALLESEAAAFDAVPPVATIGTRSRAEWQFNSIRILTHEMAHMRFATHPPAGLPPQLSPTALSELDELNSQLSEFLVGYRHVMSTAPDATAGEDRLRTVITRYIEKRGQGIRGILTKLRCSASCADVDTGVRRVFESQTAAWPAAVRDLLLGVLADPSNRIQWPMPPPPRPGLPPTDRKAGMGGIQRQAAGHGAPSGAGARLPVSKPGDPAELEAERVADDVMRSASNSLQPVPEHTCACGGTCTACAQRRVNLTRHNAAALKVALRKPIAARRTATVVQRDGPDYSAETKDQFAARVRQRASARLTQNIAVLDQWKTYINGMEGFQLRAQLLTGVVKEHAVAASPSARMRERFETEVGTYNEAERMYEGAMLDIEASYRERSASFMGFLGSKVHGYVTTPPISMRLEVLAGERTPESLPPPVYVPPDPRYSLYADTITRFEKRQIGGCQTCHEINLAWQKTAERYGDPLPKGDFFVEFALGHPGPLSAGISIDPAKRAALNAWMQSPGQTAAPITSPSPATVTGPPTVTPPPSPVMDPQAAAPEAPNPFLPVADLPKGVELPAPRSNLCGGLPPGEESQRVPNLASWGKHSAVVARVIERIDAVLTPLGPRGYRVLGRQNFDALYAASPDSMDGVRAGIVGRINKKQQDYKTLQGQISSGEVPYEELCPIVDELLPSTNTIVKEQALADVHQWQRRERILQVLELTLLALSLIYPPSMALTIPAGMLLGLARVSMGIDQRRQGAQWTKGTGSGLYSLSQEAEAPGLADRGKSNIIAGTVSFGLSAISLARLITQARASAQLLRAIQDGTIITHAQYPGVMILARNGRLLMVTETGEVLGYGMVANGQISWTRLEVPFNPFQSAPGGPAGGASTAMVPYGQTSIVPYGSTSIAPFGAAPWSPGTGLAPVGVGSLAAPTIGSTFPALTPPPPSLMLPGPPSPLLLPPPAPPPMLQAPLTVAVDPGGRGLYAMSEMQVGRLPAADAVRLRTLQSRMPTSPAELSELCALRARAAGGELAPIAGTPEHMLSRWNMYTSPPRSGPMTFQRWASGHPSRMANSVSGVLAEERYREALAEADVVGRNAVVKTLTGQTRQVDILIEPARGERNLIQIKAGEESLTTTPRASGGASLGSSSLSNKAALTVDAQLIRENKDKVTWVFEKRPSGPLVAEARRSGVDVIIRVDDAAGRANMIKLMRRAGMTEDEIQTVSIVEGSVNDAVAFVIRHFGAK